MANTQNLFEKYGIKEVADVTFYRIEKKEKTFESQRTITAASILKGALELRTVYPLNNSGVGEEDGFQAYVFVNADLIKGTNYDCDDGDTASELATGIYSDPDATTSDAKLPVGTHEFSYPQQVCMLFARNQNLIAKTGTRYVFADADTLFGEFTFNDEFASAPKSAERVVVAGLAGKFDEGSYDLDEINEAFGTLTNSIQAKAYDVSYGDYAELVVEDEMGYYNNKYLGYNYQRVNGKGQITFYEDAEDYISKVDPNSEGKYDPAIAFATMWGKDTHYSINDAIDALRQKRMTLDAGEANGRAGLAGAFGGYKVNDVQPAPGVEDIAENGEYSYSYDDEGEKTAAVHSYNDEPITTKYPLEQVLNALNEIGTIEEAVGKEIRIDATGHTSNRAIYVKIDGTMDTAAGAYLYLLHNKNSNRLALDEEGIFKFSDKKGNTLYYQDPIFKGVEWLALVIIGDKGLIFIANRNGSKNNSRIAWMVNENGYVDDRQAAILTKNGLIHTTTITVNNESFEATCAVNGLKVHKTVKKANRYTPVLFLDTLKVSTIEQTAEEVYATGGHGNADLIGWDYGKEITLNITDALFTPASMAAIFGSYEGNDFRKGVKETKKIDRFEKCTAKRNFIVPAGNMNGTPTEAENSAQAVYYDPNTMEPYADGTPIAEGEIFYKWTRSVAYEGQSLGRTIEISADKFPGTYKVVGDTYARTKESGADERFQFVIPMAKMNSEHTITLEADGDPTVFEMSLRVLRPDDGVMVKFIQYDVVENEEENDGSTMVKDTENLNLLDDAELFEASANGVVEEDAIGATEY